MNKEKWQKMIKAYKNAFKMYGPKAESVAWRDELSQKIRFKVLLEMDDKPEAFNGKSVLDVGCGLADLYQYFQEKKIEVNYTGIDLVEDFIQVDQKKYPQLKFILGDYLESDLGDFDYVFASGMFSYGIGDNEKFIRQALEKMVQQAKYAVGFNFLTKFHTDKEEGLYYFDPAEIYKFAIELPKVKGAQLRMDYELIHSKNDATVYLYL